ADAIHSAPSIGVFYVLLNNKRGPTQDIRVREALSLTVDRELISTSLLRNEGRPAYNIVPDAMPDYDSIPMPMEALDKEQRKARARELLAQAGYSETNALRLSYKFG